MSIESMAKIQLIALENHKNSLLKKIQELEIIDIVEKETNPAPNPEINQHEFNLAELKSTIKFLSKIESKKRSFIEGFIPDRAEASPNEIQKIAQNFEAKKVITNCKTIENRINNLNSFIKELNSKIKRLLPWQHLKTKLNNINNNTYTQVFLGSVKSKLLTTINPSADVTVINQDKTKSYILVVCLKDDSQAVRDSLGKIDFEEASLPQSDKTAGEEIREAKKLVKQTQKDVREQLAEAKELTQYLFQLKCLYDHTLGLKTGLETKQKLDKTNYTFILEGWIERNRLSEVTKRLSEVAKEVAISEIKPAEDEQPPIVLNNPKSFSPFELITQIYGTPKYGSIDPTLPLSIFFALFFGLCLGDFGYGLALGLASIYFRKRYKLPVGGKKLFKLLFLGGIVSMAVGILTGSYFGFNPKNIPEVLLPLKNLLLSIQIIDPIKNPLIMLIFSLALGVIQLLFGMGLQMYHRLKNKEFVRAILDDGLWIFFLSSLVFLIVSSAMSLASADLAGKLSLIGAGLLILTQGRHKKNPIQKLLSGLLSLYNLSSYMGDALSYSRLLALGMSSAIIGSVINILSGMVKGVPVVGIILMVLLLIFGHIFNLVVSTLGAFVHSTRLQMVEFFSKFFEGGGREFKPYRRVAEYTILKN